MFRRFHFLSIFFLIFHGSAASDDVLRRASRTSRTSVSRRLQQDYSLFEFVDVCTRVQNDIVGDYYITDSVLGILIWIYHFGNRPYDIVVGSCDAVCPCGGSGRCKEVFADGHTCECDDGFDFDGRTCLEEGLPICGGFTNATCPDDLVCVDGPGENSTGLCLLGCAILEGGNSTCPSEELQCKMDPQCDVSRENCTSICVPSDIPPFPFCHGTDNVTCEEGYSCVCSRNVEDGTCAGTCKQQCNDRDRDSCGQGRVCIDNVCEVIPAACGGPLGLSGLCPNDYSCIANPRTSCEFDTDNECTGVCAVNCGGLLPDPLRCQDNTFCLANPAVTDDTEQSSRVCQEIGPCGIQGGLMSCPFGTQCVKPSRCRTGDPDCPGVCQDEDIPVYCGGDLGPSCPIGRRCADDPRDGCQVNDMFGCEGICEKECGGVDSLQCEGGLFCNDDPFDDCDPAMGDQDCVGICQDVENPPLPCGGEALSGCPLGFECRALNDVLCAENDSSCFGLCRRV